MLHWLFIFSYFLLCLLASLGYLYINLMHLVLISEIIIIIIFCCGLIIGGIFNIYFLLIFSFFFLVLGALELALSFLLYLL